MSESRRLAAVGVYATAMAWVEAAVVVYLRVLVNRVVPYQPDPLPASNWALGSTELVREVATLIMLAAVGWLAGRTTRSRLGYAVFAFGVWDILYYVFLRVIIGWPGSLLDWDILFLLPLPWWGPVLAPVAVAGLMMFGGALVSQFDRPSRPLWSAGAIWGMAAVGIALALYAFMSSALRSAGTGMAEIRSILPTTFNWPLFAVALALMSTPVLSLAVGVIRSRRKVAHSGAPPRSAPSPRAT